MLRLCVVFIYLLYGVKTDPSETCPAFTALSLRNALIGTELKVKLLLYTRQNPTCAEEIHSTDSKYLNVTKKTTFIIHGYRPTGSAPVWILDLVHLLLSVEDMNVIIVDWNQGATTLIYSYASRKCRRVAEILKKLIDEMLEGQPRVRRCHGHGFVLQALTPRAPCTGGRRRARGWTPRTHSLSMSFTRTPTSCNITTYPCNSYRNYRNGKCTSCEPFWPMPCPILGYYAHEWKSYLTQQSHPVTSMFFDTADKEPFCIYHYLVDIITWNKNTRRGTFSIMLVDEAGRKAESRVNPEAATFQQYNQITLLIGFDQDLETVERISLTFSTGSVIGPKFKLRILQMRFRSLTNPERPPLCRYDLVLRENTQKTFKPIPC
ncbi:lipase member H isoform 4-T4 [Cyanocitta cristata]